MLPSPQVIYTLRSPKDVLVSLYHFSQALHLYKDPGPMDAFLQDFLSGNREQQSWVVPIPKTRRPVLGRHLGFMGAPTAFNLGIPLSNTAGSSAGQ